MSLLYKVGHKLWTLNAYKAGLLQSERNLWVGRLEVILKDLDGIKDILSGPRFWRVRRQAVEGTCGVYTA